MSIQHYRANLQEHVDAGAMTQAQMDDLLAQREAFDANRETIKAEHDKKVVGYCNGEMFVGYTMHLLLAQTKEKHPGKMTYFETIGYELFEEF